MDEKQQETVSDISQVAKKELEILDFWNKNEIFKKTLDKKSPNGEFVFYDGPPFPTGSPHYGNLLPGTIKDVIPRYKTMKGFHVERKWGWDCHGLPIENEIQKANELHTTKDIEKFGIEEFNAQAKNLVSSHNESWKEIIPRTGRWVDMENAYTTMNPLYTQSVWWAFKKMFDKGLVYEDFKVMHVSPKLETTLSNFEVNQGYRDIKDLSATVKFELVEFADANSGATKEKTFVLAWTTTPWTLPGNVALAVGEDVDYVKVKSEGENYIVAKDLVGKVFKEKESEILEELKGKDLIGKEYKPVFDYYKGKDIDNLENAWKIYGADFVTIEDGTGVVHIAPAFGDDDYSLLKKYKLPFVQHVNMDGTFKEEVSDFAGVEVKPKEDHTRTDVELIKYLAQKGLLFDKEKIEHSYPFCWRTDAPLINYATSSWFIKVTDIKDKLIANNNKINWVPENVGSLRFGNWLKEARDWAVSRRRYWGTPIPIWKSEDGKNIKVIGSLDELKHKVKSSNKFFLARHGQSDHNIKNFLAEDNVDFPSHLTEKGREGAKKLAKTLKSKKIDLVYVSPLDRTQETVKILQEELGFSDEQIITDERIKEFQSGKNGMHHDKFTETFGDHNKIYQENKFGETLLDIRKRVGEFVKEIDSKNENKNILIVSHDWPLWMLKSVCDGWTKEKAIEEKSKSDDFVKTGNFLDTDYFKLPVDQNFELDLHRPYIDQIEFEEKGKKYNRVNDVFDGWIDSGSMPFASNYYPMQTKDFNPGNLLMKSKNFPADFIAEGLDQTRGWFYTLLVLNTALFGKSPYKNVVVNGLVLAEDGRKMSKSLKNFPDVISVFNKYGADSFRYYMMNSPAVRADDLRFMEKGVDEVMKKIVLRLDNVVSFYELFKDSFSGIESNNKSQNILDRWILARITEVNKEVSVSLENYELDKASRPFTDFIDDLSAWYLRRSRDRVKERGDDGKEAIQTLSYVLIELSKTLAPFMPFKAEDVYKRLGGKKESVHLEKWNELDYKADDVLEDMQTTRDIVTKALEKRASSQIKVRQPLQKLEVKNMKLSDEYLEIIKEEVNVKEVLNNESMNDEVVLDTRISPELKEEGNAREIMRAIQDLRKKNNLDPEDEILVHISYPQELEKVFIKYMEEMKKATKTVEFVKLDLGDIDSVKINEFEIQLVIQKK